MKALLIIEPHWEGHHLKYACWLVREAVEQGYEVWFAGSPGCLRHRLFREVRAEYPGCIRTVPLPADDRKPDVRNTLDLVKRELRYYKMFRDCYRRLSRLRGAQNAQNIDYVLVPYLDYCLYAVASVGSPFGDATWSGLAMQPTFHLRGVVSGAPDNAMQRIKERLFLRLLNNKFLWAVATLDETLVEHVRRVKPQSSRRVRLLPEPAEIRGTHSRSSARRVLGIPEAATVILVYGELDFTKGVDALLAATGDESFPGEAAILLAGRQSSEVEALLASERAEELRGDGRLYELNKFVTGEDEHAAFEASDVAWLGYRAQYVSSGVLLQAAASGLPIVGCEEGLIGLLTSRHGLGLTVSIDDSREVAQAVSELVRDRGLSRKLGDNGRSFSADHTVSSFRSTARKELLSGASPQDSREPQERVSGR